MCYQKAAEHCFIQFFEKIGPNYPAKDQRWGRSSAQFCGEHPVQFLFYKKRAGDQLKNVPLDRELPLLFSARPCVDNRRIVYYYAGGFAWLSEQSFQALNLEPELIGR